MKFDVKKVLTIKALLLKPRTLLEIKELNTLTLNTILSDQKLKMAALQ